MTSVLMLALAANRAPDNAAVRDKILRTGLTETGAYTMLTDLCTNIGGRLSGSPQAARAVEWAKQTMQKNGMINVREIPCMVPHWVRGDTCNISFSVGDHGFKLSAAALGMSPGTPPGGIESEVVEVKSLEELTKLGNAVKGKIVFFNRPFDKALPSTFAMYGSAGDQRFGGPALAAKFGAIGALVRSLTLKDDDQPHTGTTIFDDPNQTIPCVALGLNSADRLSEALQSRRLPQSITPKDGETLLSAKNKDVSVRMDMNCQTLPDVSSASVIGEIRGSEYPDQVIVIGGHLDSWDLAQGAHDDGAGVCQGMEALRLIKELGITPKRTIRCIAWMNEENGGRGAEAYAAWVKTSGQRPYASMESDSGGFMPRGMGADVPNMGKVKSWQPLLEVFGVDRINKGGGDADNSPLGDQKSALFSLQPDDARYFDYHHAPTDVIDNVNPRELEFGAMAEATMAWLVSEEGL